MMFSIIAGGVIMLVVVGLFLAARANVSESSGHRDQRPSDAGQAKADIEMVTTGIDEEIKAEQEITNASPAETKAGAAKRSFGAAAPRLTALIIIGGVPVVVFFTYLYVGHPELVGVETKAVQAEPQHNDATIETLLANLEARLRSNPANADGWLMLGRSNMSLGRYVEAVYAFEKAYQLTGNNAKVMMQYADALAMAAGRRVDDDRIHSLLDKILMLEPNNVAALWLSGIGAEQAGDLERARDFITRARSSSERSGQPTVELDTMLERLGSSAVPRGNNDIELRPAVDTASVDVHVDIIDELRPRITSNDTIFVFARAPGVAGPPLAVARLRPSKLPLELVLDETMAMAPMFKLKPGIEIIVTARVSRSGETSARAGDLQGTSAPLLVGQTQNVEVRIDEILD